MSYLLRVLLLGAALVYVASAQAAAVQPLDSIIAVVNKEVILSSELDDAVTRVKQEISARGGELPADEVLKKQVLDRLILTHLQLQRAKEADISVSDDEVNQAMASIAKRNHLSVDELQDALQQQGIDFGAYRKQLRNDILISKLRHKEVDNRVSVSDQDVDLYLESRKDDPQAARQYHLQHILIAIPSKADAATRAKLQKQAEGLLEELRDGKDFGKLAIGHSDGQQALKGGDLGWISAKLLPTAFAAIVPSLKPGQISDVIADDSGFHIVKLLGVRNGDQATAADQQLHLRHILIVADAKHSPAAAKALAERLYQELKGGADFADLAKRYSQDPGSAAQGGDLGWQDPAVFDPAFREQVSKLKKGELTQPFQTRFGWHIAQLLDRRTVSADAKANSEREQARQALFQQRAQDEYETWLRRIRDEAYVQIRLPGSGAKDDADIQQPTNSKAGS